MKLYHLVFMSVIAVTIILGMTNFKGSGMLTDLQQYNSDINTTKYDTYDYSNEINSEISELDNNTGASGVTNSDTEQNILTKLWQNTKALGSAINSPKKLMTTAGEELGFDSMSLFMWAASTLLALFILVKISGRFFLDR